MARLTNAELARIVASQATELASLRARDSELHGVIDMRDREIYRLETIIASLQDQLGEQLMVEHRASEHDLNEQLGPHRGESGGLAGRDDTTPATHPVAPNGVAEEALRANIRSQLRTRSYRTIWIERFRRARPTTARAFDEATLVDFIVESRG
jgi:hypothetical protein